LGVQTLARRAWEEAWTHDLVAEVIAGERSLNMYVVVRMARNTDLGQSGNDFLKIIAFRKPQVMKRSLETQVRLAIEMNWKTDQRHTDVEADVPLM
jgi:hypothetical protein